MARGCKLKAEICLEMARGGKTLEKTNVSELRAEEGRLVISRQYQITNIAS